MNPAKTATQEKSLKAQIHTSRIPGLEQWLIKRMACNEWELEM